MNSRRSFLKSLGTTAVVGTSLVLFPLKKPKVEVIEEYIPWDGARDLDASPMSLGEMLQKVYSDGINEQISENYRDWERVKR